MKTQRCYNGVRLFPDRTGPCPKNVDKLDSGAIPMIYMMQRTGLEVDLDHFAAMEKKLEKRLEETTETVHDLTGYYLNLGSGDQVADLLFKKLGLKQAKVKMTDSGKRESVEEEVLVAVQHQHPVVGHCLKYKEFEKLLGTYVRPIPKLATRVGLGRYRMYPNFRTTRVPSGRLSCSDPNLLAMPTRTQEGRNVRRGFIAGKGYKIVSVDESQIEVRLAAHRSKDPALCNIYSTRQDIYSDFAIKTFRLKDERYQDERGKWKYPTVNKEQHRRPCKTCILAAIYDVTAGGLQEQMPVVCERCGKPTLCLKCEQGEEHTACIKHDCSSFSPLWTEPKCQGILNNFYIEYSGLMDCRIQDHNYMRRTAMMVDMWGRMLHTQAVRSVHPWVVSGALREGNNFPYQSGAQGTIKLTMDQVHDDFLRYMMYQSDIVRPLLQVHDELLYEVREDCVEEVGEITKQRFEGCCRLEVPIEASVAVADNWGSLDK